MAKALSMEASIAKAPKLGTQLAPEGCYNSMVILPEIVLCSAKGSSLGSLLFLQPRRESRFLRVCYMLRLFYSCLFDYSASRSFISHKLNDCLSRARPV